VLCWSKSKPTNFRIVGSFLKPKSRCCVATPVRFPSFAQPRFDSDNWAGNAGEATLVNPQSDAKYPHYRLITCIFHSICRYCAGKVERGTLMRFSVAVFVVLVIAACSGCQCCRQIEQWKCNHLGMCHFGLTPTNVPQPYPYAYPANVAQPVPMGIGTGVPVYPQAGPVTPETYASQPTTVYPSPMIVSPTPTTGQPSPPNTYSGPARTYAPPQNTCPAPSNANPAKCQQ
jgi:hypothetical protein